VTTYQIRIYGDEVLRLKSAKVKEFGSELHPFLDEMVETMIVGGGVGLAAPQVGISKRIAVMNPDPSSSDTLIKMINPRIVSVSEAEESLEEGCLSIPDVRGEVIRHREIEVLYWDWEGREHTLKANGLLARIIQHELDHLDGILFIDHLSLAKRIMLKSKLKELKGRSGREG
jgi:peptide deformylase